MRDEIIRSIDFKQVRTIISKEKSDTEEWKNCNLIPFMLLHQDAIYTVVYIVFRKFRNCGYSATGNPQTLYQKLIQKIDDSEQVFIIISDSDKKKEGWFITRD